MNYRFIKYMVPACLAAAIIVGLSSCADDLDQGIQDEQTTTTLDTEALLAKIYGSLHLTGQQGGSDDPDMSQFDEGNSAWYRRIFEANELCSDECIWTWQSDEGIPELTNISWNSSHGYNELTYYRMMYNITLCNFYLDQTASDESATTKQYRAEVRFIRALNYFHYMDLYGKAPFKDFYDTTTLPTEMSRTELFDWVIGELTAINGEDSDSDEQLIDNANNDDNYGRADKVAANLLLARIYLNAEIYTGTAQWQKAYDYAEAVINSGYYSLCTTAQNGYSAYEQLFMGDNGENDYARQEIIFPIRCDANTSRSYGGSLYPIASCAGSGTPDQGLSGAQWTCNRAREALVLLFFSSLDDVPISNDIDDVIAAAGDDRCILYSGCDENGDNQRTVTTDEKTTFTSGLGILKWSNLNAVSGIYPSDNSWPNTDIPYFRLAEAYLTLAEANYRLGGDNSVTVAAINALRSRANASTLVAATEQDLIDEWGREFYFEGRRRSDLVRFGLFTSGSYLWDWKGGSYTGNGVNSTYNIYPIPYTELSANENMTQNPGY